MVGLRAGYRWAARHSMSPGVLSATRIGRSALERQGVVSTPTYETRTVMGPGDFKRSHPRGRVILTLMDRAGLDLCVIASGQWVANIDVGAPR